MRAFEFRLDSVLKVQERRKKLAEVRRQQAANALAAAEAEVARLQRELEAMAVAVNTTLTRGGSSTAWQAVSTRSRWLADAITAAEATARQARADFARANEHYRERAVAVEVLVHLRKQRWQEYREDLAAQEQQRVEEFVLRRWQHAQDTDEPIEKDVV